MYLDLIWYVTRYFKILKEYMDDLQIVKEKNVNISPTESRYFNTFVLKMTTVKSEINF